MTNSSLPAYFVDPLLSANLYCTNRLSEVVEKIVAPAWASFKADRPESESYLWMMRYSKGGEHLKVRWHGISSEGEDWRKLLEASWYERLQAIEPLAGDAKRVTWPQATPIDEEDEHEHPDRTMVWTRYRRSHVSLGYHPYQEDLQYIALLTRCLGWGAEVLLSTLAESSGPLTSRLQQNIHLRLLISGLSKIGFSAEQRSRFLLYQRDALIRGFRSRVNRRRELLKSSEMSKVLDRFDKQVELMGNQGVRLASQVERYWSEGSRSHWDPAQEAGRQSIRAIVAHVEPICRDQAHDIDPFADSPLFPPLLKPLHGVANQIGLSPFDEAFTYHLLLVLSETNEEFRNRPVQLKPSLGDRKEILIHG